MAERANHLLNRIVKLRRRLCRAQRFAERRANQTEQLISLLNKLLLAAFGKLSRLRSLTLKLRNRIPVSISTVDQNRGGREHN